MSAPTTDWVLALDISANCTGYCFGTGDGQVLKYGKYIAKRSSGMGRGQKLLNFSKWFSGILNGLPHKPTRIVIESPYYRRNVKTFAILNMYVAVAAREAYRVCKIEVEFVAPSAVKAGLHLPPGQDHEHRKYLMVKEINRRLGMNLGYHKSNKKISDDDIADAIGIFIVFCERVLNATS